MPNLHFNISITQRSRGQSAVASAAYQSGDRLFSEYDQKYKDYSRKQGVVYTEIMLPPNAPPEFADRETLWNAAEEIEKQWNSQLARRLVLALPRKFPQSSTRKWSEIIAMSISYPREYAATSPFTTSTRLDTIPTVTLC